MNYLVKKAKRHDKEAFAELMEQQKMSMYKIARSYLSSDEDIADVMQETILTCYEKLGTLKNDKYFKTWLVRILINKCKDLLYIKGKEYPTDILPEQGEKCMALENYEFYELLKALDEKYRTILILYYAEGFKIAEIAQLLEMDENTVKTRLSRGRKRIEKEYCSDFLAGRRQ